MLLITLKTHLAPPTIPALILQCQRKVKICLELLTMIASRWPVAQMIREVSEIVFSERKFEELLATATNTGEAHQGSKHQPYRRALLQGKQARPEFMLPKARNIVRMVLTTRADEKVLSHAGVVERPPVMVEDISRTPELRASIESSLGLAEGSSSFELSRETFQFLGALSQEEGGWGDYAPGSPLIPLFGRGPY